MNNSPMYCAICLLRRNGVADEARTMIQGTAVCYDHAKDIIIRDFPS